MVIREVMPYLATRDIQSTVEFYTTCLGLRIDVLHPDENPTLVIFESVDPVTGARLGRIAFADGLWPDAPAMTGQITLDLGPQQPGEPSRVLALLERVQPHASLLWGPEIYDYGRREAAIRDPNGYALVLSEETADPPTCEA